MRKILPYLIGIGVLVLLFSFLSKQPEISTNLVESNSDANLILFWGDGCTHCENVKKYFEANGIYKKIAINQKEVYYNRQNQKELENSATKCPEIDSTKGIGVPFLFDKSNNKCVIGDKPIIDYVESVLPSGQ